MHGDFRRQRHHLCVGGLAFLIFEIFTISGLSMALALASVPTWAFGIYLVRRFAQAGMTAYVGGVVVGAVFMMLRFGQIVLVMDVSQLPQLEYAPSVKWVAPVTWVLLSVGIGAIFFPDNRKDDKGSD
ncbi:hypothetical protein QM565_02370 [Geitlerinema splendidum]|nr:hypothetical protein [Geitlerinema splendidum]